MKPDESRRVLVTDIGSTTTKALLLEREHTGEEPSGERASANRYHIRARHAVPTTVEKPDEDVAIGVRRSVQGIEKETGLSLLDETGRPRVPYLTTSSAGGGLQILVFGLTSSETGMAAQLAAHGAGGVILRTFTIDDPLPAVQQMRLIRELHPDLVLMAGGVEGGEIANIVRLAEILSLANPAAKYESSARIPFVFCGNTSARPFLTRVLGDRFDLHFTENIRPTLSTLRTGPASAKVLQLFMDTVMERAPGYSKVRDWTARDILPTPTGVEKILQLYAQSTGRNTVIVDIGGATTDILAHIAGISTRTVAANIGVSYSICNVLAQAGSERIRSRLPATFAERDVCDYIANKMLNPTYTPRTQGEIWVEQAVAAEGIAIAWQQHRGTVYRASRLGLVDRLKLRDEFDPLEDIYMTAGDRAIFQLSDIDVLIGTGGVLAHVADPVDAMRMLVEGFLPSGVTHLAIDRHFNSPHMGMLSLLDAEGALDLFTKECLQEIGTVIAPIGPLPERGPALEVDDARSGKHYTVGSGEVLFLPGGGELRVRAKGKLHVARRRDAIEIRADLPVLIDARGRDKYFNGRALTSFDLMSGRDRAFTTELRPEPLPADSGENDFHRDLPYEGDVLVHMGDRVEPETPVARNLATPPRIYIIDLQRFTGYDRVLSAEDLAEGTLVKVGEEIGVGDRIFRHRGGIVGWTYHHSPVRGKLIQIEGGGLLILREIQDYAFEPVEVDVAADLGVKPRHIRGYLRRDKGDFVQRGERIANKGPTTVVVAPVSGVITRIDTQTGTVTIHYDLAPVILRSFVAGVVRDVRPQLGATIAARGTILHGRIGFGGEQHGELRLGLSRRVPQTADKGKVLAVFEPIDEECLRACVAVGVSGVIAPAIGNREWVSFNGAEIGVGSTGDEEIPFTVILTEGFGDLVMSAPYRTVLESAEGRIASISGRTQIRAGVVRPIVVIGD